MMKCIKCGLYKTLEEFFKDRGLKDGHANTCKICKQAATYAWRKNNKNKYNSYMRQKNKDRYPEARLKRYDLTTDQHSKMLKFQNNVCAICKKSPGGIRPLCIDHRHSDGKIRGLLCYGCNRALHILEAEGLLFKALTYLQSHK